MIKKSEFTEQCTVVQFCEIMRIPFFAIPNGGSRNKLEAVNLKRSGVKAGVPDLCIPIAKCGYHGLFIELKYGKNKMTVRQKAWQILLNNNGYKAVTCYSAEEAMDIIKKYMEG